MNFDLASILSGWIDDGERQAARIVQTAKGRPAIQFYEAQAVLQMEMTGRPDGVRPSGCETMLHMLRRDLSSPNPQKAISPQQWIELDREFVQFRLRRRAAFLAASTALMENRLADATPLFRLAHVDAQHCLGIIDLAQSIHPSGSLVSATPEQRPAMIADRQVALAQMRLIAHETEAAIDALQDAARDIRAIAPDAEHSLDELASLEKAIRDKFSLGRTLREQLDDAVANEDFELAATLRDILDSRAVKDASAPVRSTTERG